MATLFLMVGLPGAGKTMRATDIAREAHALRLSPDEWMDPLFGASDVDGIRDIVEGRLIWVAARLLHLGQSAVLDFGLWGREERLALHWLADSVGATASTIFMPIDRETQFARVEQRAQSMSWAMSQSLLDEQRSFLQEPDEQELAGTFPSLPASEAATWPEWIAMRWPTALDDPFDGVVRPSI